MYKKLNQSNESDKPNQSNLKQCSNNTNRICNCAGICPDHEPIHAIHRSAGGCIRANIATDKDRNENGNQGNTEGNAKTNWQGPCVVVGILNENEYHTDTVVSNAEH